MHNAISMGIIIICAPKPLNHMLSVFRDAKVSSVEHVSVINMIVAFTGSAQEQVVNTAQETTVVLDVLKYKTLTGVLVDHHNNNFPIIKTA